MRRLAGRASTSHFCALPSAEGAKMGGFSILDVAIGLVLTYLLLALLCTTLMEWIAQIANLRGRTLVEGTRSLLGESKGESPLTQVVLNHALIRGLGEDDRMPSYIPSPVFAKALRDTLSEIQAKKGGAESLISRDLRASLQALETGAPEVAGDPLPTEPAIAKWFDHAMDRLSGTYKRTTRSVILLLALVMTVALNANTIALTSMLWQNPTLRAYMVERAKTRLEQGRPLATVEYADPTSPQVTAPVSTDSAKSPDRLLAEEQDMLGQLFSWKGEAQRIRDSQARYGVVPGAVVWATVALIGWLITALAASLGAPFWFDTLNLFMRARAAGDVPAKTTETTR